MKPRLSLLTACLILSACGSSPQRPDSGIVPPAAWQSPHNTSAERDALRWWTRFASPQLDQLIEQAQVGSYDLAAAIARVRQARADTVIAGGSLLPEIQGTGNANRQKLLRGDGYRQLDADSSNKAVDYFDVEIGRAHV